LVLATTAFGLEAAKAKVRERLKHKPGRYVIFNWMTQEKLAIEPEPNKIRKDLNRSDKTAKALSTLCLTRSTATESFVSVRFGTVSDPTSRI
jgi:hypothetical protein